MPKAQAPSASITKVHTQKSSSPSRQRKAALYKAAKKGRVESLVDSLVLAIDSFEQGDPLFKDIGLENHEACVQAILENIATSVRTRHSFELSQYYYLGHIMSSYLKDSHPLTVQRKFGLNPKEWNMTTFLFDVFTERSGAIQYVRDLSTWQLREYSADDLLQCARQIKALRPHKPDPMVTSPKSPSVDPDEEYFKTDYSPKTPQENSLPEPDDLWNVWTNPDLDPGVVSAAEALMEPPATGSFLGNIDQIPSFDWTQEDDDEFTNWLDEGDNDFSPVPLSPPRNA